MKFTRFEGEVSVGYQFVKSVTNSQKLIVVFPGFKEKGRKPWPEYVIELASWDINKLFLVDDICEIAAAPFITLHGTYCLENTIKALIDKIVEENHITTVVVAGNSSGGAAAVYYGYKYDYHIIAVSPGMFYGKNWSYENQLERIALIAGDSSQEQKRFLDRLIPDCVENYITKYTKKAILVYGQGEPIAGVEGYFFQKILKEQEKKGRLIFADYQEHKDCVSYLSRHFREFLEEIFTEGMKMPERGSGNV